MIEHFTFEGRAYRVANKMEVCIAQSRPGAPHVTFACTECGHGTWSAKNLALGDAGGYTGVRNIFYLGAGPECSCPPNALRMIVPA